jgi:hypothetical protein
MPDLKIETHPSIPHRINYYGQYCGRDKPNLSGLGKSWWYNYPIQNFDYQFNSWGFRDEDFEQYIGKKVNICLGDSITLNLGGPVEHSWCSQLAKHFDIPTLNFGMEASGNDAISIVYNKLKNIFDIQNVFVMYSFLHRRLIDGKFEINPQCNDQENFEYFLKHRISNAFECALPIWCWSKEEKKFLSELEIYFLDILYFFNYQSVDRKFIDKDAYNNLKGPNWPTLEEFIQGAEAHPDMLTKEFGEFISIRICYNRDGRHLNQETNKVYADYFYNQWKQRNES